MTCKVKTSGKEFVIQFIIIPRDVTTLISTNDIVALNILQLGAYNAISEKDIMSEMKVK